MKRLVYSLMIATIVVIVGLIFLVNKTSNSAQSVSVNPKPQSQRKNIVSLDLNRLAEQVNVHRQNRGLSPLERDELLDKSAQDKCVDMASRDYWSHDSQDGTEPWEFIRKYNNYNTAGENLAYGQISEEEVVTEWMNSETHKENLLNGGFTNVGYAQCSYSKASKFGEHIIIVQHLADTL